MLVRNATYVGETSSARDAEYSIVSFGIDTQFSQETGRSNALIRLTSLPRSHHDADNSPPLGRHSGLLRNG
jgi:hypothetical protein